MDKLVTIIMPTYNGSKWLKNAILSIQNQTYKHWELIVVDDGSSDNTAQIVLDLMQNEPRIKYLKNEQNLGIQKTLNRGLKEAKGEYVARLDDDDSWPDPLKLQKQVTFLNENSSYVLVGTGVVMVNEEGKELFRYLLPEEDNVIRSKILSKNCFAHSSVLFRKDIVMNFGGYSEEEDVKHFEDYDLWMKLGTVGKLHNLPIYGLAYRMREGSLSATNRLLVFKKLLNHINKYKKSYPKYLIALIRAYLRYVLYSIYIRIPKKFSLNKIVKLYKEI